MPPCGHLGYSGSNGFRDPYDLSVYTDQSVDQLLEIMYFYTNVTEGGKNDQSSYCFSDFSVSFKAV